MAKRKEVKPSEINKSSSIIGNEKPRVFDFILLLIIAVPFLILILFGNQNVKSNSSSSQGLTNSWQNASSAFSNESAIPNVSPSPDKIIPTFLLSTLGK